MQYLWIIIIAAIWLVWGILGIKDFIEELDGDYTINGIESALAVSEGFVSWISCTLFIVFMASLIAFLIGRLK